MLIKLLKLLRYDKALLTLLLVLSIQCGIFLFITFRPTTIAPKNHTYILTAKSFFYPIFFYPNEILQSKNGQWGIKDTHTTLPQKRAYAVWFFVFAGKIAAMLQLEAVHTMVLLQFSGGIAMFIAAYFLIRYLVPPKYHILAIYFALAYETSPLLPLFLSAPSINSLAAALPGQITIFRSFSLPHHAWGEAFGLLSVLFFLRSYSHYSIKNAIGLCITTALSLVSLPPVVITLGLSVYPVFLLWALTKKTLGKIILPLCIVLITVVLIGLQTKLAFSAAGYPWSAWTPIEKSWWKSSDVLRQYAQSLVVYVPFFILLIISSLVKWKSWPETIKLTILILASWVVMPFIFIPLSNLPIFPIANMRLLHGDLYFAAGVLAAIGLIEAFSLIKHRPVRHGVFTIMLGLLVGFSTLLSLAYITSFLKTQDSLDPHAYPLTTTWEGVRFLQNIPIQSGILVREHFGEIIPGFADVRVFIGGTHGYPDWLERQSLAIQFFTGTWTIDRVRDFLQTYDISYIFYGPDEQASTQTPDLYPDVLKPVFQNSSVTIYAINPK